MILGFQYEVFVDDWTCGSEQSQAYSSEFNDGIRLGAELARRSWHVGGQLKQEVLVQLFGNHQSNEQDQSPLILWYSKIIAICPLFLRAKHEIGYESGLFA